MHPNALGPIDQGLEHIARTIAHRENLSGFFHLGGDSLRLEKVNGVTGAERSQRGMQELPLGSIGVDYPLVVTVVGDVAAASAGHQDFDSRARILFKNQHPGTVFGRGYGRHQAGGTSAGYQDIPNWVEFIHA
jgi:hypothetical protein